MTRLSALANVRLDNFVYTVDSLRSRLTDEGGLALMFMVSRPYIESNLFAMLYQAFETPPLLLKKHYWLFNVMFLAGPGFAHLSDRPALHNIPLEAVADRLIAPDDAWPFLYLAQPGFPSFYMNIAAMVLTIAVTLLVCTARPLRRSVLSGAIDFEMMLFGAAFMLIETCFVTDMNLLFGATWRTSAVVFAAILLALLLSTLTYSRLRVDPRLALVGVIVSLIGFSLLPVRQIAPTAEVLRVIFAVAVCGVPIFYAGMAFAGRFAARAEADVAFGWNIVGAVVGGILELLSMVIGLPPLFLVGALLYAVTLWLCRNAQPTTTPNAHAAAVQA
jgi:hypothetical protein